MDAIFLNEYVWIVMKISSIGFDNVLAPSRWQATIWTIYDQFTDAYMSLGLSELIQNRHHSSASAMELCLLCIEASIWWPADISQCCFTGQTNAAVPMK